MITTFSHARSWVKDRVKDCKKLKVKLDNNNNNNHNNNNNNKHKTTT